MTASGPIRNGTIQSVPGYGSEALFGEVTHANDIFHIEADFRSTELQFTALIQCVFPKNILSWLTLRFKNQKFSKLT